MSNRTFLQRARSAFSTKPTKRHHYDTQKDNEDFVVFCFILLAFILILLAVMIAFADY